MSSNSGTPTTTPVMRVEFRLTGTEYPFFKISSEQSCTARLKEIIPREDGYAEFFTFRGTEPERVFEEVEDADQIEVQLLSAAEETGLFEFFVCSDHCPAVFLSEEGALPRKVHGENGTARLVADVPKTENPGTVIENFLDRHENADLVTKQKKSEAEPIFGEWELQRLVERRLTDRQQEVLLAAHEAGYYDWPREKNAESLADDLNIASATLHKHLRAAERKLVTTLFEEPPLAP